MAALLFAAAITSAMAAAPTDFHVGGYQLNRSENGPGVLQAGAFLFAQIRRP